MLDKIYYGNTLENWGVSALIIAVAFVLNYIVRIILNRAVRKMTAKSKTHLDNIFVDAIEKPLFAGIILFAVWIAAARLNMSETLHDLIAESYDILTVMLVTWFFTRLFTDLLEHSAMNYDSDDRSKFALDPRLLPVVKRAVVIIVWTLGAVTALHNVGLKLTTLFGALGIGGIAFALAAQDTVKNLFGGITILIDRTFRIGDVIRFDSAEGAVIDIGLRSTRIRTADCRITTVPNYKLTDALITNISSEPGRRIVTELGLTYATTADRMQEAIDILRNMPSKVEGVFAQDLTAVFTAFGDSALVLTFIYFIKPEANINETRSRVNFEILKAFGSAGLDFAYPSQTVYIAENRKDRD